MFLDLNFYDYSTGNKLTSINKIKFSDFCLKTLFVYTLKYNNNISYKQIKKHVRYTLHFLIKYNTSKSKTKMIRRSELIDACSCYYFGDFDLFKTPNPDVFSLNNQSITCFPSECYYKKAIQNLYAQKKIFSVTFPYFFTKTSSNTISADIKINDPNTKCSNVFPTKELYQPIFQIFQTNNDDNLLIEDDLFEAKFSSLNGLEGYDQISHVFNDLYFGIKFKKYKYSFYNFSFEHKGKYYLFNTWHGNLCELEFEDYNAIKNNIVIDKKEMRDLGFIVDSSINEYEMVTKENAEYISTNRSLHVTICPTFKCNARCSYCFEKGIDTELTMSDETIEKTVDFIQKNTINNYCKITWFGGEPLVGAEQINKICNLLREKNIKFNSTMITNGYYIDEYIEYIKNNWNCRKIQITIDGLKEKYEFIKKMGVGSFKRVINNIHLAADAGIRVTIRINYNTKNYNDYLEIIEYLSKEFGNKVRIYFHDIMGEEFDPPYLIKPNPLLLIYKKMKEVGYKLDLRDYKITRLCGACAVDKTDYINIGSDGGLTKCEHYIGQDSVFSSGTLKNGDKIKGQVTETLLSCTRCKYYPICGGGCYSNHLLKKNYGCTRIKGIIIDLLKQYVEE